MAYLASQAITEGYYLSGVVSAAYQTVSGPQLNQGLKLFNFLLSMKSINGRFVPYYKRYEFNTVAGQGIYFIPGLIESDTCTFNIGTTRFPTTNVKRKRYYGSGRADNIQSLPFSLNYNRVLNGTEIHFYFVPNTVYPIKLMAKFSLPAVTYDDDLSLVYDQFYIDYLQYELAQRICAHNAIALKDDAKEILEQYWRELRDMMPLDLSMQKVSTLQRGAAFSYADANIGRGWRPTGS